MSSITTNISISFFCSSFETGRIIPEVCCLTKAAIKNVHFCTELSKVAALVATCTCLFSCCNSSNVETIAGNSVTKMMIESCLSTQRVAQIGFSFCREEAEPETSLLTLSWNIDMRCAERYRKTHLSDIVAIAFLITGNCDEVLMTKLRTWLQQWVYMGPKGTILLLYSSLDTTIFSAHITCAIITLATHMFQIKSKLR